MGGSKGQSTQQTSQSQTYTPNQQAYGYLTDALGRAQQTANLPFNVPQAPVAGFSQDQQNAFQGVRNAQGMAQPYINQAQNYFSPQGAQAFYNPMAQSVTNQLQNIFGQQNAQTTGQLTQAAGGVGADRIAVGQANLANQQGLAAGQTYANLYNQAVQQAQGAGYGTAALGSQAQNAALQGAQAQLGTGGLQQQLQQAQLNAPYQQQVAQAQFPYQQAQWYGNLVGGLAGGLGGTTQGTGNTTSTPAQPSIWSQLLGGGLAAAGGLGQSGAFGSQGWLTGSSPSYGGGNAFSGDAYGGSSANPLPGLSAEDYGAGFAEGGEVSDQPIDIAAQPFISPGQMKPMQTHIPQLNLNPPQQSGGGGGSGGGLGDIIGMAAKVLPFLARGGGVDSASMKTFDGHDPHSFFQSRFPKGYAEGGSPDGESVSNPFTGALDRVGQGATRLATTPGAVMQPNPYPPGSEESSWYEDQRQKAMTDWSGDMSSAMTLGAGAIPAEAGALRSGMSVFPKGYLEKVPMDQKMSLKGVSHPGFRWQVVDGKTGAVMRKDIQTRGGASRSADRLDNKYGGYRYRAEPVAADAGAMSDAEKQFMQEHGFDLGTQRARGGRTSFAEGGSPDSDVISSDEPFRMPDEGSVAAWRQGVDADRTAGRTAPDVIPAATPDATIPLPEIITGKKRPGASHALAFSPEGNTSPMQADSTAAPTVTAGAPAPGHSHDRSGFIDSPWAALTAAGLGIMGGTSPFAGVNIGQGGMQGLKMLEQQRENVRKDETVEQAAHRLEQEAQFHEDQFKRETIGEKNAREQAARPYEQMTAAAKAADQRAREQQAFNENQANRPYNELTAAAKVQESKPVAMGQRIDPLTGQSITTYGTRQPDGSYKPVDLSAAHSPEQAQEDDTKLPANAKATQGFLIPGKNVPDTVDPSVLAPLDAGTANMVRAIDEGRMSLSQVPMKQRFMVERLVHAYDGTWDGTVWNARNRQQGDLATNGTAGKMLTAVNQLLPHLSTAFDRADALANTNYPEANTIKNWWMTNTGDPRVKEFGTVREVAAMDAARLLRGTGQMAEKDIEAWRENIASQGSPQQLKGVLALLADDLIGARITSLQHEYRMNMRQEPPEFLSPEAKTALAKIKAGVAPKAAAQPAAGGAPTAAPAQPPTAAALPDAAKAQLKEGQVTTFGNGQKWKLQNGRPIQVVQ